ncbi:MAG: MoaD/ThiS family protein [Deltaproteobacteria bacterium]|jgi:molybdopterin converting factor small subunit|nr:MoaD/ThiS family protein [Deltaproteobacteria bacterium]MBT7890427.1 MoaD/ThiS family protein [Deltaproteobacteria bacterium]
MNIKVLVFAHIKELIGSGSIDLELSEGATGNDLLQKMEASFPQIKGHRKYLKLSMNGEYINADATIIQDAEIAIFPPVSGG